MINKKEILIEFVHADVGFLSSGEKKLLLKNISLEIRKGELVALIGRNGSGKTTLLRSLMRLHPLAGGNISVSGKDYLEYSRTEFARMMAYVSTDIVRADNMNLRELVELGRFPYTNWIGSLEQEDKDMVNKAIQWSGLSHLQHSKLSQLSDGERQRAMIARTLAQNSDFLLLDEPSAFLDIPNKYDIVSLLRNLCQEGKTVLFSTHDLNLAIQFCDKIWLIDGENIIHGSPEDLIIEGWLEKLFNSYKVHFNRQTADFEPFIDSRRKLFLVESAIDPFIRKWTIRAFNRSGFEATEKEESGVPLLEIIEEKNRIVWKLQKEDEILFFESLYELSHHLINN